ncbi:MAG TPA: GNAT family N-acetyltransferase [Candidatus Dormibacteraeota bacterium]
MSGAGTSSGRLTTLAFEAPRDLREMQALASRLWPAGPHPGGLAWEWAIEQMPEQVAVIRSDSALAGWVGFTAPDTLVALVDEEVSAAAESAVGWCLDCTAGRPLRIAVAPLQRGLLAALAAAGFTLDTEAEPWLGLWRPAGAAAIDLSDGYAIREVHPDELDERVEVHRIAWLPAELPYAPSHRPNFPDDATSRFERQHYARVRETWPYDPALDLVVVAPDGRLAACCIAWLDPASKVAEIEPLGVVPSHRRRGLAGALCLEAARRVVARGGHTLFINTGPMTAYPAPAGAYGKVGFKPVERGRVYSLA